MSEGSKKKGGDDSLELDPSLVRKKLSKALHSEPDETIELDLDDLDFDDVEVELESDSGKVEEEKEEGSEELVIDLDEDEEEESEVEVEDLIEELEEEEKDESEEVKFDETVFDEGEVKESVEAKSEPEPEVKDETESEGEEEGDSEVAEEEEDDVDYSFEGYAEVEDPEVLEEVREGEARKVIKEYEQLEEFLKSLDGAVPITALLLSGMSDASEEVRRSVEAEYGGIYVCHERHLKPLHPPIEDLEELELAKTYVPDAVNVYEVEGLRGFWQFTGVVFTDLDVAVEMAKMLRYVPPSERFPCLFKFGELVLVMRKDGFHLMARMKVEPWKIINVGIRFV